MSNKSFIKSKFTYETPEISILMFEDDTQSIKCYLGHFVFSARLLSSNTSSEKLKAASNFLSNIHGSMAISSFSESTPKFVVGEINVPTIELPVTEFSAYEFATFMFYKTQAILGNSAIVTDFKFVTQAPIEVCVELDVDDLNEENPMIDEDSWLRAMNNIPEDEPLEDLVVDKPWWKRPSGELRDFFNNIEELDEEQLNNLIAFNIDLGVDITEVNERSEKIEKDTSLAKRMLEKYKEEGEIPKEMLAEIQDLADSLGFDLNELLESISDGTMFGNYDDEEGSIRHRVLNTLKVGEQSDDDDDEDYHDDDEDPNHSPTIVRL